MTNVHTPFMWCLIKVDRGNLEGPFFKVFASWMTEWRIPEITRAEGAEVEGHWVVQGHIDSVYHLNKSPQFYGWNPVFNWKIQELLDSEAYDVSVLTREEAVQYLSNFGEG